MRKTPTSMKMERDFSQNLFEVIRNEMDVFIILKLTKSVRLCKRFSSENKERKCTTLQGTVGNQVFYHY